MDLPTDVDELVAALLRGGWREEAVIDSAMPIRRVRRDDGFVFEARHERNAWRGRLDRGDGWRELDVVAARFPDTPSDRFDLSKVPGARGAALAFASFPQHPYLRWEALVPRCIEWLSSAPPAPSEASGDLIAAIGRHDFHQACLEILDRRTHGLHLRPMPPVSARARTSPRELLRWLRHTEVHQLVRWGAEYLLRESQTTEQPGSIGGESQLLWVAYLDDLSDSPDPQVDVHDHRSNDFVRGDLLETLALSRYLFDCLVTPSDFHSAWVRPAAAGELEPLWDEVTMRFGIRVGARWLQLGGRFLLDDPAVAAEELGEHAELADRYEWGTRTV